MSRKGSTEAVIKTLGKHPYLMLFAGIMFITPLCFGHMSFVNNAVWIYTLLFAIVVCSALRLFMKKNDTGKLFIAMIGVSIVSFSVVLLTLYRKTDDPDKPVWHLAGGALAVLLLRLAADTSDEKLRMKANSLFIMGLGFFLKFFYVLSTSMYTRQNDVGGFEKGYGHAGYIAYLSENLRLPDFDPRERWQFCHPPLHHIISSVWLWINRRLFMTGEDPARESMQMLSLFYSMCIMITAYRILRHFGLKGASLYIPLAVINFHPAFVLLSGSVNNDVLSVAFIMGAVICTLKWREKRDMKTILKTALCIGLGMMTKLSAALVAPPVALIFLITFIKHRKEEWKPLLLQFSVFGAVCIPLGMWFPLWNYFRWGVPLNYVHEMPVTSFQYVGDVPFAERITDFSLSQFSPIYEHWRKLDENNMFDISEHSESNPLIALLKNSVFGESFSKYTFSKVPFVYYILPVLFGANLFIAASAFLFMLIFAFNRCRACASEKAFLLGFYAVMMGFFYKTAADYPFTCTMNFRYITPTAIIGALFIGFALDAAGRRKTKPSDNNTPAAEASENRPKPKKRLQRALTAVYAAAAVCFAVCSVTVYMFLA